MPILSEDEVYDFLGIEEDENAIAIAIHNSTEEFVKKYCNRSFEATDYSEFYHGLGSQKLLLKNYPIINIKGVYLSVLDVIKIYNSNKYTSAVVTVTSTGVELEYNGTTTSGDFTFAANTTLSALSTAINNAGSGWVSEVLSDYGTIVSTELLELFGQSAINSNYVYLSVPYNIISQYKCDKTTGMLYFSTDLSAYNEITESPLFRRDYSNFVEADEGTFNKGFNNIFIKYRAGFEEDTMPADLKMGMLIIIKDIYDRHGEDSFGLTSFNLSSVISKSFDKQITEKALPILNRFKTINV